MLLHPVSMDGVRKKCSRAALRAEKAALLFSGCSFSSAARKHPPHAGTPFLFLPSRRLRNKYPYRCARRKAVGKSCPRHSSAPRTCRWYRPPMPLPLRAAKPGAVSPLRNSTLCRARTGVQAEGTAHEKSPASGEVPKRPGRRSTVRRPVRLFQGRVPSISA